MRSLGGLVSQGRMFWCFISGCCRAGEGPGNCVYFSSSPFAETVKTKPPYPLTSNSNRVGRAHQGTEVCINVCYSRKGRGGTSNDSSDSASLGTVRLTSKTFMAWLGHSLLVTSEPCIGEKGCLCSSLPDHPGHPLGGQEALPALCHG